MGHKYLIAALSLVFLATSCGPIKNKKEEEVAVADVSAMNSGFGGGIYFDSKESYSRLDLRTGIIENYLASGRNMSSFSVTGDRVLTVKRSSTFPEILVMNPNKEILVRIPLPENPEGTPKLSRNGDLIIVGGIVGDTKIYNMNGVMVKNLQSNISSYDWLLDGRVIFSRFGTLYITDAAFKDYHSFRAFPATPQSLAVSPDGISMAFTMNDTGVPHIWVMDLNTESLRQISYSTVGENFPAWSPDGNQIVLAKGKLATKGKPTCLELWVVNSRLTTIVDLDIMDGPNTLRVQQNEAGQIKETCALSAPTWRSQ